MFDLITWYRHLKGTAMQKSFLSAIVVTVLVSPVINAEVSPMTAREQEMLLRHLLPLPHEINMKHTVTLHPKDIRVKTRKNPTDMERHAAETLRALFGQKNADTSGQGELTITLGIIGEDGRLNGEKIQNFSRLQSLPNQDQAYVIEPVGEKVLLLAALDGKGVWYSVQTMMQLIEPSLTETAVTIPLAHIVDWPDLEERGLWNFTDPPTWIPWLSSLKLNYGKMGNTKIQPIEQGKPGRITIDGDVMRTARLYGFNYLPFIMHFNFLHEYGLFTAYPELAGYGETALSGRYFAHKHGNQHRVPCASQPRFTDLLEEWMLDIASQGADEVSCWLSERPAQCGCPGCTFTGQFVLEARACVKAWQRVRETYPDFTIRLFISTTTDEKYWRVLAETPPEVKIERCCASWIQRITHSPRDIYVDALFDSYADDGYWVASYDVPLGAYGRVDTPEFKVPCSSAHRIRDYVGYIVRRGWRGAYGMMAWCNQIHDGSSKVGKVTYGFNIHALAEWSWNMHGRDERAFVIAWATREGYIDPEGIADWSEIMGPVEFDVFDSEFPICYSWGRFTDMIANGERPYLGEGLFRYYLYPGDFDRKLECCDRAYEIAEAFHDPYLKNETAVVRTYVELAKYIYRIAERVATDDLRTLESQKILRQDLDALQQAGVKNRNAIITWRSAVGPEPWHWRVHDAVKAVEGTVEDIRADVDGKYLY